MYVGERAFSNNAYRTLREIGHYASLARLNAIRRRRRFPSDKPRFAGLMDVAFKTLWHYYSRASYWIPDISINVSILRNFLLSREIVFPREVSIIKPFYRKQCNNITFLEESWRKNKLILNFRTHTNVFRSVLATKIVLRRYYNILIENYLEFLIECLWI